MPRGFGFLQAKPTTSFAPIAVTPDELGSAWRDGRVALNLHVARNGERIGGASGAEMAFSFRDLIAHVARTRRLRAGTIIGSGTVSNKDRAAGSSCLAEKRVIEKLDLGRRARRSSCSAIGSRWRRASPMGAQDRSDASTRGWSPQGEAGRSDVRWGPRSADSETECASLSTGAAGFLGRALLRTMASRAPDDEITALDVTANSSEAAAAGRISWLSGAVDDRELMEKAGLQDFDIIYHLVSVPGALAEREPALGRRVNLDATLDLFDRLAASGRRPRVIYASSVAVYGEMDGRPISADSPDPANEHLRRPQADGGDRALRPFPEGRAFRNRAAPSGPRRATRKSGGLRLRLHERIAARIRGGRALRLPSLAERRRLVDVGGLRRHESGQGRLDRALRRGSASGPSPVGRRDRRCAFRSLRARSPIAHFIQSRPAHRGDVWPLSRTGDREGRGARLRPRRNADKTDQGGLAS